jgi:hypothetical protein
MPRLCAAAVQANGGNRTAAAQSLGIGVRTMFDRLKAAEAAGLWSSPDTGRPLEIPPGFAIRRISAYTGPDDELKGQWTRWEPKLQALPDLIAAVKSELGSSIGRADLIEAPAYANADLLTVYPVTDTHLGSRAWAPETGANYDLEIAERLLDEYSSMLIASAPPSETAVILNLGDYFDVDNRKNATPESGNVCDVDSRYQKIFRVGLRIKRRMVERALQKHKRVILAFVEGNHDPIGVITLQAAFEMFFEGNPRVTVDPDVSPFFWHEFGVCFIAGAHGDKLRPDDMPGFMATEKAEVWGRTKCRHAFFGHVHHHASKSRHGVTVETLETIAAKNAWSAPRFTSGRSMKSVTFHRERGKLLDNTISLIR